MLIDLSQTVGNYFGDVFQKMSWVVLLGYAGQILFTMRFVVQWIASERAGKSVIPMAFWFFSIGGGLLFWDTRSTSKTRYSFWVRVLVCSSICAIFILSDAINPAPSPHKKTAKLLAKLGSR
jgi:hypothetical protein